MGTQDNADKDKAVPPAVKDDCLGHSEQQMLSQPTQEPAGIERYLHDHSQLTDNAEGSPIFLVTVQYYLQIN